MSSLWAVSGLLLSLTMHKIECLSIEQKCDFLTNNGTYQGLGIHKEYGLEDKYDYFISNKKGLKWKFELSEDHKRLELLSGEYHEMSESIVKSFGIYFTNSLNSLYWANCNVYKENISDVICVDYKGRHFTTDAFPLTENIVIFRGHSRLNKFAQYSVILDRENKSITYFKCLISIGGRPEIEHTNTCSYSCPKIEFIYQMRSSLISRLDGVVDFNFGVTNHGFLLLFNIESRPMFCFQSEEKAVSDHCKSIENLSPAFEECFQEIPETSTPSEQKNHLIDPLIWVLIIELVLMVILVVAIQIVMDIRRRRSDKELENSVTHRTYHPSRDEPSPQKRIAAMLTPKSKN